MSRKQKDFDPKRNHIFAAAIDELRRREGKRLSQKEIADRMGVTEDTISRIMRLHNQVTEDIITQLQTASGCIFNLQWLRGEDATHMLAQDLADDVDNVKPEHGMPDPVSRFEMAFAEVGCPRSLMRARAIASSSAASSFPSADVTSLRTTV